MNIKPRESKENFLKRFMADETMMDKYPDRNDRYVACLNHLREKKKQEVINEIIASKTGPKGDKGDPFKLEDVDQVEIEALADRIANMVRLDPPDLSEYSQKLELEQQLKDMHDSLGNLLKSDYISREELAKVVTKISKSYLRVVENQQDKLINLLDERTQLIVKEIPSYEEIARGLEDLAEGSKLDAEKVLNRGTLEAMVKKILPKSQMIIAGGGGGGGGGLNEIIADSGTATGITSLQILGGSNVTTSLVNGVLTISASGGGDSQAWNEVIAGTMMSVGNGYIPSAETKLNFALPSSSNVGDIVEIAGKGTGGWRVTQGANQRIMLGDDTSTTGVSGSIESFDYTDSVKILCITANLDWKVIYSIGNVIIN